LPSRIEAQSVHVREEVARKLSSDQRGGDWHQANGGQVIYQEQGDNDANESRRRHGLPSSSFGFGIRIDLASNLAAAQTRLGLLLALSCALLLVRRFSVGVGFGFRVVVPVQITYRGFFFKRILGIGQIIGARRRLSA